jgi:hypothetical protein
LVPGNLPDTFSADGKKDWPQLQRALGDIGQNYADSTGLSQRGYVLDFGARRAVIGTLNGVSLTEKQPIYCE